MDTASLVYRRSWAVVTITDTAPITPLTVTLTDLISIEVSEQENESLKWSIAASNKDNKYDGDNVSSPFYGYLDPKSTLLWTITMHIETDDATPIVEERTWSYLRLMDISLSADSGGGLKAAITGTDQTASKLRPNNQTMASWKSVTGNTIYSNAVQDSICTQFLQSAAIGTDSYPIRLKHFQAEKPVEVLQQILDATWGKWQVLNGVWTSYQAAYKPSGPADWTITDYKTVQSLTRNKSRASVVTRGEFVRTMASSHLAADKEGNTAGVTGAGEYVTLPLDFGVQNAMLIVVQYAFCIIDMFSVGDSNNVWALWPNGPPGGTITQVKFRVQAKGGITDSEGAVLHWHVKVMGNKPLTGAEWGYPYEEKFHVKLKNTTLEAELGEEIPAREPIIEDQLPNQAWLTAYGEGHLLENAKKYRTVTGKVGPYLNMSPGQTIHLLVSLMGVDSYHYLESVKHYMGDSLYNDITATTPRNDTIEEYV